MPAPNFSPKFVRSAYDIPKSVDPLSFYVQQHAGKPTLPEKAWKDPVPEYEQRSVVQESYKTQCENPLVSIVIPVYNNFVYTLRCIYSIAVSIDTLHRDRAHRR